MLASLLKVTHLSASCPGCLLYLPPLHPSPYCPDLVGTMHTAAEASEQAPPCVYLHMPSTWHPLPPHQPPSLDTNISEPYEEGKGRARGMDKEDLIIFSY